MGVFFVAAIIVLVVVILIAWMIEREDRGGGTGFNSTSTLPRPAANQTGSQSWDDDDRLDPEEIAELVAELDQDFDSEAWLGYSVAGESQRNANGGDRQEILRRLRSRLAADDSLEPRLIRLLREPRNRYDPNAISVSCIYGQVGYITRDDAIALAPLLDSGRQIYACVDKLLGGDPDRPSIGIWLRLSKLPDFGAAREAADLEIMQAERDAKKAKKQAEKEAQRLAKLAAREEAAAIKRTEREAAAALKKQERESARAAKPKPQPKTGGEPGSQE
jgi:hypothetical protein